MLKRLAVTVVFVAGCAAPTATNPAGAVKPSPTAGAPATTTPQPFALSLYQAEDFQLGVPSGWVQTVKDQPLQKSVNRCTFRLPGPNGTTQASLIVTSGTIAASTLAEQFGYLKAATVQQGETITAESKTDAGDSWGLRSTGKNEAGAFVNFRFVVVSPKSLFLIGLSGPQGGPLTDDQVLQIASSFALR